MKKFLMAGLAVFVSLLFISCTSTASNFRMEYKETDLANWVGEAYVYVDSETGVEYIIFTKENSIAITPRYERIGQSMTVKVKNGN